MNNRFAKFPYSNFIIFAVLLAVSVLSSAAQSAPATFDSAVAGNSHSVDISNDARPRIIETAKKPVVDVAKPVFSLHELERQAFVILNARRAENNLPALIWNEDIARIARMHSENMAKYNFFSHTGLDGLMVNDRADQCGVSKWRAIGENIAYNRGYDKPADFAAERWMKSDGHRDNILNRRWKESAVGVAIAKDGSYYFTQVFLDRK